MPRAVPVEPINPEAPKMATITTPPSTSAYNGQIWRPGSHCAPSPRRRLISFPPFLRDAKIHLHLCCSSGKAIGSVNGENRVVRNSSWDEKPYELLPGGEKAYLDEQDVVTFLDPPRELNPIEPSSYNPASYLWKKISDIPEERRRRLLLLLNPRLISAAWAITGVRYDDIKLSRRCSSDLLSGKDDALMFESWYCRKSGGPLPFSLVNFFKMVLFRNNGECYGRFIGGSFLDKMTSSFSPLYFTVRNLEEVMPTEQPCDLACELGNGLLDIQDLPPGFPKPAKHPQPLDDHVVVYIRHVGPGVAVGQAWQEGLDLEQVPRKFCGEILMVKDYAASSSSDEQGTT